MKAAVLRMLTSEEALCLSCSGHMFSGYIKHEASHVIWASAVTNHSPRHQTLRENESSVSRWAPSALTGLTC